MNKVILACHGLQACGPHVLEKTLRGIPGVAAAYANPATEAVALTYDLDHNTLTQILRTFGTSGYKVHGTWLRFQGRPATGLFADEIRTRPGVLAQEAGPAPGEFRVLVHPEDADVHSLQALLESHKYVFLGSEDPMVIP